MVEEREPKMLRAFTAMQVDASGQLKTGQIQSERAAHPLPGRDLIQILRASIIFMFSVPRAAAATTQICLDS